MLGTILLQDDGFESFLSDAFWEGTNPPYIWNASLARWEIAHKQAAFGEMNAIGSWNLGFRPSKIRYTIEYVGGLSNCTINISVIQTTQPPFNIFVDPFLSGEKKQIEHDLTGITTDIIGLYPFIVENDPSPLLYLTEVAFKV